MFFFHSASSISLLGHASKNSGGQCTSYLRTIHYGPFWVDLVQCRNYGMPAMALGRAHPMSDRCQALLSNPFFYVKEEET